MVRRKFQRNRLDAFRGVGWIHPALLFCFAHTVACLRYIINGTADVITNDACFTALTAFQAGDLLGFAMKLLDFPAQGVRVLDGLRGILSQVVGHDVIRALWGQHYPEQFQLVFLWEAFELDQLTVLALGCGPRQRIDVAIGCLAA